MLLFLNQATRKSGRLGKSFNQTRNDFRKKLGPNNPFMTGQQYANAMTKFIELAGF